MKDFDQNSFLSDISSIDWDSILNCGKDINTAVENWSNVLSMIIEKQRPCGSGEFRKSIALGLLLS